MMMPCTLYLDIQPIINTQTDQAPSPFRSVKRSIGHLGVFGLPYRTTLWVCQNKFTLFLRDVCDVDYHTDALFMGSLPFDQSLRPDPL